MHNFIKSNIDIISLYFDIIATIVSIVVAILTYSNLKEFKNSKLEESRAQILFYIEKPHIDLGYTLVLKNFGKSIGKISNIETIPQLKHHDFLSGMPLPTDFKNIVLAPNQSIKTFFKFEDRSINELSVKIEYETCNKTFIESYKLNINLFRSLIYKIPSSANETDSLNNINQTLLSILNKLP